VLLQKDPPHELLIGTDLLPSLGFQVIQKSLSKELVDLLTDKTVEDKQKTQVAHCADSQNDLLSVKLISFVQIPARHKRLVRDQVEMNTNSDMKAALFMLC